MINSETIQNRFRAIQDKICEMLTTDGDAYREDRWTYEKGKGGGITRVWERGRLLEKGGVNFSAIRGAALPASAATQFDIAPDTPFLATGVSLVLHPWNPMIPTIHMNIRYFEAGDTSWFGGGIDLTPYYPVYGEIVEFHRALEKLCKDCGEDYTAHKQACDAYFYLRHRDETRGVGGLFFDHRRDDREKAFTFVSRLGESFPDLYQPFIDSHRDDQFTGSQREFQLYRRGRYVEFNLVYDRGTLFGLQSQGRTESILMSLPATASWRYDWHPAPGSPEAELTEYYLKPQDWVTGAQT